MLPLLRRFSRKHHKVAAPKHARGNEGSPRLRPVSPLRLEELEDRLVMSGQAVDLGQLRFVAPTFTQNGNSYSAVGPIELGFVPGDGQNFQPIVTISGSVAFTEGTNDPQFTTTGEIDATIFSSAPALVTSGTYTFDVNQLVNAGLSLANGANFTVAGAQFTLNTIRLQDVNNDPAVQVQGQIAYQAVQTDTALDIAVNGDNYVTIDANGISLNGFTASISGQFEVFGLSIIPQGLTVAYSNDGGEDNFSIYGNIEVSTPTGGLANVKADLGTADDPGLVIENGTVKQVNVGVSGSFVLFGLTITPGGTDGNNPFTFNYDANTSEYEIFGDISVTSPDQTINLTADLGTQSQPGLVILNGTVTQVNIDVSGSFSLFGVTITPGGTDGSNPFTFEYDASESEYEIFGDLTVQVANSTITADLGDQSNPGLEIVQGKVTQVNFAISGEFDLFGITIDAQNAGIAYQSDGHTYEIFGQLSVPTLFDATVSLGTDEQNPGIKIVDGHFQLDKVMLSLGDVDFGAFTLQTLEVSYSNSSTGSAATSDDFSFSVTVEVEFPEGWSVGGTVAFVNGEISEISINWHVDAGEGIEIGDTGLFLTAMSATVQNLDQPTNLVVSGTLAVEFGPQVTLLGEQVSVFRAFGSFTVDKDELDLEASVWLGALNSDPGAQTPNSDGDYGNWSGVMGSGKAEIDLDWGDHLYTASFAATLYDGIFQINAGFQFDNSGDVVINAMASVHIPHGVPFIGDKTLASINFLFEFHPNNGNPTGVVAAWVELDIIRKFDIGIEFNMSDASKQVSVIGTSAVNSLVAGSQEVNPQTFQYPVTINVDPDATSATIFVTWAVNTGSNSISVLFPGQGTPIDQTQFATTNGLSLVPQLSSNNSTAIHLVGSSTDPDARLVGGTYTITLTNVTTFGVEPTLPTGWATFGYVEPTLQAPKISAQTSTGVPITVNGTMDPGFASNAQVSFYLDTDGSGYDGVPIGGSVTPQPDGQGNYQVSDLLDVTNLLPTTYYVYARIDDGTNTPVYSAYSQPFAPFAAVIGKVMNPLTGNPISGAKLTLSTSSSEMSGDPLGLILGTKLSSSMGQFAFYNLLPGTSYTITVDVPQGFVLPNGASNQFTFVYDGTGQSINFNLFGLTLISGTVYTDLNANHQQDAGEPGLAGWTVLLKQGNSTVFSTSTNAEGVYAFFTPPTGNYLIEVDPPTFPGLAYTQTQPQNVYDYQVSVDGTPFQQLVGNDFGEVQPVIISGNVSGYPSVNGSTTTSAVPLAGWKINVVRIGDGTVVASTTTAGDGSYSLTVQAGFYSVEEQVPSGWRVISPFEAPYVAPSPVLLPAGSPSRWAATGDFDGDGNQDLAIVDSNGSNGGQITVYYGDGDGTFDAPENGFPYTYNSGLASDGQTLVINQIIATDVNGDGLLDLVIVGGDGSDVGNAGSVVNVLFNNGKDAGRQNQFTVPTAPYGDQLPGGSIDAVAGDFDGQAGNDLAVVYAGGLAVFLHGGRTIETPLPFARFLAVGDVNNDGMLDLVIVGGTQSFGDIVTAYGNGDGTFTLVANNNYLGGTGTAVLSDVDGDGNLDLIIGDMAAGNAVYIKGYGADGFDFNDPQRYAVVGADDNEINVLVEDVNGDGLPDIIAAPTTASGLVGVYLNQGVPTTGSTFFTSFAAPVTIGLDDSADSSPSFLTSADFNADGLPDLVATDISFGGVVIFPNETEANSGAYPVAGLISGQQITGLNFIDTQLGQMSGVVFADANGNGRQDAGDAGVAGYTVYLDLNNNGRLDPGEPTRITTADGTYNFAGLPEGPYHVRLAVPAGWKATTDSSIGSGAVTAVGGQPGASVDFGVSAMLLEPIPEQELVAGTPFSLLIPLKPASNGQHLVFSLSSESPKGTAIDPITGLLTWTPLASDAGSVQSVTILVTDPFDPTRKESQTVVLTVSPATNDTSTAAWISQIYQDLLHRPADSAGIDAWTALLQTGVSRYGVVTAIANSPERLGQQVDSFYATYLNRSEGASERTYWLNALQSGLSETQAAVAFLTSSEYQTAHAGTDDFVADLYRAVLGRQADAQGQAGWIQAVNSGVSRAAIAKSFLNSDEFFQTQVEQDYNLFLGRKPDAAGLAWWLNVLEGGSSPADIASAILASDESFALASR